MVEGFADRMRRMLTGMNRPPEPDGSAGADPDAPARGDHPGRRAPDEPPEPQGGDATVDRDGHEHRRGQGVKPPLAMRPYPGDYPGVPAMHYAPEPDGLPDPGEVVWTWVPFEEDPTLGKDRPVLLIGVDGDWLLGVMLTSRDHDARREHEREAGREWIDVGPGAWDAKGRQSEARTDRIVRVDPDAVRREGAVLDRERFDQVAQAIRATA